jgi:predicted ABC-type ATPase
MIIVGGANGSGKTTFASRYFKDIGVPFLNADVIASELASEGVAQPMIAAGRIFFTRLREYLFNQKTFVVETTLSGNYVEKVAKKAIARGFRIITIFIFLDSPETCIQRVSARVRKGGHQVPQQDIIRRFGRANANFREVYTQLSDEWFLYYNGLSSFQMIANFQHETLSITEPSIYQTFHQL